MKYISLNTKQIFEIDFSKKRGTCPECSSLRSLKNKEQKCLDYHKDTDSAYCFHCETTFVKYKAFDKEQKEYKKPEYKNNTKLSDKALNWFTGRMISQNTLNYMKVYSDIEFMPQFEKKIEVICFPYFANEKLVNIKYRGAQKSFKMYAGAELIFWNYNSISKFDEIIIVEGEIDLLTYVENGFENVISVPNGAQNNLQYLDSCFELFLNKKIILSTDNDLKGCELKDEFIRRFGAENCKTINFRGCKDANEFFCKFGGIEFKEAVKNSKDIPVKGIVYADDLLQSIYSIRETGIPKGKQIGIESFDNLCTFETGMLGIITGQPSSGKSEFIDYICAKLNFLHGWKSAFFTPENYPLTYHYDKLFSKIAGKKFNEVQDSELLFVHEYLNENFFYIMNENDMKLQTILDSAKHLVKSKGIKILVIDPYNRIDHEIKRNQSETIYISEFLDKLTNFARFNNILVILVAHPKKVNKGESITLYDIAGSAHFYNKCDYGITVDRIKDENGIMGKSVNIAIQKIKYKHMGQQGVVKLEYNYKNGRYECSEETNTWDDSNWLVKDELSNLNDIASNEFINYQGEEIPF